MELLQAKGNTWYINDWQLIPLYKTDDTHCILLDTGIIEHRDQIEQTLLDHHLTPVGILSTHSHTDHSANNHYFQEKYQIPTALSFGEAGLCATPLNLKAYYYMLSPGQIFEFPEYKAMLFTPDQLIMPGDTSVHFCGVDFQIVHTPGHSPDHISIGTPDDVLYLGDAILTGESLYGARLPYFFSIQHALDTMESLKSQKASLYLAAHKGIHDDIATIADESIRVIKERCADILEILRRTAADKNGLLSETDILSGVCMELSLRSSRVNRSTYYKRNILTYVEYFLDCGTLTAFAKDGVTWYQIS